MKNLLAIVFIVTALVVVAGSKRVLANTVTNQLISLKNQGV